MSSRTQLPHLPPGSTRDRHEAQLSLAEPADWESQLAKLDQMLSAGDIPALWREILSSALGITRALVATLAYKNERSRWEILDSLNLGAGLSPTPNTPNSENNAASQELAADSQQTKAPTAQQLARWEQSLNHHGTTSPPALEPRLSRLPENGNLVTLIQSIESGETLLWELLLPADSPPLAPAATQYLLALVDIAADGLRRWRLARLPDEHTRWRTLWRLTQRLAAAPTLIAAAQTAVQDLTAALVCDRVAILTTRGETASDPYMPLAVSGSARADARSRTAQLWRQLATEFSLHPQPRWFGHVPPTYLQNDVAFANCAETSEQAAHPTPLTQWWERYVEETAAIGLLAIPWQACPLPPASQAARSDATTSPRANGQVLHPTLDDQGVAVDTLRIAVRLAGWAGPPTVDIPAADLTENPFVPRGLFIIEWFQTPTANDALSPSSAISGHTSEPKSLWPPLLQSAAAQLEQRRVTDDLPGIKLLRWWGNAGRRARRRGLTMGRLAGLAAVGLLAALCLVPAELQITVRGTLWPRDRRQIFAPEPAIVSSITVGHGDQVQQNELLAQLESPELTQQQLQLIGEIATAEKRAQSLLALRLQSGSTPNPDPAQRERLTAEEAEIAATLQSAQAQLTIVNERLASLKLLSPMRGTILTWNPQSDWRGRPVARGQALLTVADCAGPWQAELRIPDEVLGYVKSARSKSEDGLAITLYPQLNPDVQWSGTLTSLALRSETDPVWGTGVLGVAMISTSLHGNTPDRSAISLDNAKKLSTVDSDAHPALTPGGEVVARIPCGRHPWGFVLFHEVYDAVRRWWW
ncbi:MAG: HlyD family efflux transporter periplasmic adaptor subunit [Pirellulales bacterium]|nr:HlyD family efflux transporter periplasmic adaptor subunit [Pirellulales bacterium]